MLGGQVSPGLFSLSAELPRAYHSAVACKFPWEKSVALLVWWQH